jgi:hypothetical protein
MDPEGYNVIEDAGKCILLRRKIPENAEKVYSDSDEGDMLETALKEAEVDPERPKKEPFPHHECSRMITGPM